MFQHDCAVLLLGDSCEARQEAGGGEKKLFIYTSQVDFIVSARADDSDSDSARGSPSLLISRQNIRLSAPLFASMFREFFFQKSESWRRNVEKREQVESVKELSLHN